MNLTILWSEKDFRLCKNSNKDFSIEIRILFKKLINCAMTYDVTIEILKINLKENDIKLSICSLNCIVVIIKTMSTLNMLFLDF